jgi:hypothetical protein
MSARTSMPGDLAEGRPGGHHKSLVTRRPRLTLAVAALAGVVISTALQNMPRKATRLNLTPVVRAVLNDPRSPAAGSRDRGCVKTACGVLGPVVGVGERRF